MAQWLRLFVHNHVAVNFIHEQHILYHVATVSSAVEMNFGFRFSIWIIPMSVRRETGIHGQLLLFHKQLCPDLEGNFLGAISWPFKTGREGGHYSLP